MNALACRTTTVVSCRGGIKATMLGLRFLWVELD